MLPTPDPSNPGLQTHATQLRSDTSGDLFRSLEDSLEEAIALGTARIGSHPARRAAANRLESAFEAAEKVLAAARSIRPRRP